MNVAWAGPHQVTLSSLHLLRWHKFWVHAVRWTPAKVEAAMWIILKADKDMKTGVGDPDLLLQVALFEASYAAVGIPKSKVAALT